MNRNIAYWASYDFANSVVFMAFLFYFSQWLVIDQGKPAWWYNLALIVASALFIFFAPQISKKIDEKEIKIVGLRFWTIISIICFSSLAILTMTVDGYEILATAIFTISTFAYLTCFLYFTPMLNDLSRPDNRSWVSGIGQGANSVGQVFGILITIPFVNGLTLFGQPGRAQALLPAVIVFSILSLPMLLFYREHPIKKEVASQRSRANIFVLIKLVFSNKPLAYILLAYFLFSDSLLTFANNYPLYLEVVFKASDTTKSLLTAAILFLAAVGAMILGKISDRAGNVKTLKILVSTWSILLLLMAFVTNFYLAIPIFLFAGLLFGPIFSITRSLVGQFAIQGQVAFSYSYYVVAERFATFIGPAVWSIVLLTAGEGPVGYRMGLFSLAILLSLSLFALRKVSEPSSDKTLST